MSSHWKVSGPPSYTGTQKTTRAGAETLERKSLSLNLIQRQICIRMKTLHCQPLLGRRSGRVPASPRSREVSESRLVWKVGWGCTHRKRGAGKEGFEIRDGNWVGRRKLRRWREGWERLNRCYPLKVSIMPLHPFWNGNWQITDWALPSPHPQHSKFYLGCQTHAKSWGN